MPSKWTLLLCYNDYAVQTSAADSTWNTQIVHKVVIAKQL